MKTGIFLCSPIIAILVAEPLFAHDERGAVPGSNTWNQAQAPTNWWNDIKLAHGHVGPWNVLGWRMGTAAMQELGAKWGQHELDIVCHIPLKTPYSCIADGLVVATGNSIGRLDIRLAEALTRSDIHVSFQRKIGTGPVLLIRPNPKYLARLRNATAADLEALARDAGELPEQELFALERIPQTD